MVLEADYDWVVDMVARQEGFSRTIYICPTGNPTIGYGFNLVSGMSKDEARVLLIHRLDIIEKTLLKKYSWFKALDISRRGVLMDMAYQLGIDGLGKFKNMIKAIEKEDYKLAAKEMLSSIWAEQTPNRAKELAELMVSVDKNN